MGDTDDFVALRERTFGAVWNTLRRAGVASHVECEDLAQDVYLIVHSKLATRNPAAPEKGWVLRVAWHVALHHFEKLKNRPAAPPAEQPGGRSEPVSADPSPEDQVAQRLRYRELVRGMPEDRRIVFELCEVEGFTLAEIARSLDIPLGTAHSRLQRAQQDLAVAAARMEAQEARAEHRKPRKAGLLLPFGVGTWAHLRQPAYAVPEGAEERVRRAVDRALAEGTAADGGWGGAAETVSAAAGKTIGRTLFGSGFVLGAAATTALFYLFHPFTPALAPPISSAPDAPAVALAPPLPVTASAAPPEPAPAPSPVLRVSTSVAGAGKDEALFLQRVQSALFDSQIEKAEAGYLEYLRRFPPGRRTLTAEAADLGTRIDAARIKAGRELGVTDAGRAAPGQPNGP